MRRAAWITAAAIVVLAAALVWLLFWALPRWYGAPQQAAVTAEAGSTAEGEGRTIKATLFYVAEGGISLVGVEREVPYADSPVDQARALLEAQLQPVEEPLMQAIPEGTEVRTVFITDRGEAYVDFSPEITTNHPGGSLDELFTVYTIVNTLTVNLPAISGVQILVDGREADTLAGHIDLRRPLTKNLSLVRAPES
ncbi:MAG TPA: GerMN domain-containing protein [Vicinamibacterales bacterium]